MGIRRVLEIAITLPFASYSFYGGMLSGRELAARGVVDLTDVEMGRRTAEPVERSLYRGRR